MDSVETRLESLIRPIPIENWRRLEDYIQQAQQLKARGDSMYNHGKYIEVSSKQAHTAFKMFLNLMRDIRNHNSCNNIGYKKQLFQLNQGVPLIRNLVNDCSRSVSHADKNVPSLINSAEIPKRVIIPQELIDYFIAHSFSNTERNIETLGILAGIPSNTELTIKGLIFPKQRGASDTCECLDDETLFTALEQHKWQVLGWIHTHPQHDLFLSSVDMHTHSSYQWLLPEAVAIVYAPLHPQQIGVFKLTEAGMQEIRACRERGFHPHSEGLFEESRNVCIERGVRFEVVDLR